MNRSRSYLRAVGSLWFAAVLLVLVLVAMASATVYESNRGTERALAEFYYSWWFTGLLALLGLNAAASLILRFPLTRRDIGFVATHLGMMVILAGALLTQVAGVRGRVVIEQGDSASTFLVENTDVVELSLRGEPHQVTLDLSSELAGVFQETTLEDSSPLRLGELTLEAVRYLPDSLWRREVHDDNPTPQAAVEVVLISGDHEHAELVQDGRAVEVDGLGITLRTVSTEEELQRLLHPPEDGSASSKGRLHIGLGDQKFEIPLEQCQDTPAPLGESGYTVKLIRYLPHATVGAGNQVVNVSDRPVNPYVEVEFDGPGGKETRRTFARFPDFSSLHGQAQIQDLQLTFESSAPEVSGSPVEILMGPAEALHVRFDSMDGHLVNQPLAEGALVETPWPEQRFGVRRRYQRARIDWVLEAVDPPRQERSPGLLLRAEAGGERRLLGIQKYQTRPWSAGGTDYEVSYGSRRVPLGFSVKLEKFQVGFYPGSRRPRSFESHITVVEPASGRSQSRVISMNSPASFGGYTLYQSSYRQEGGRTVSILSVARDPGQLVAFIGFFLLMGGMVVVLGLRMADRRRRAQAPASVTSPPLGAAALEEGR